jgi:hypothetical protein
MTVLAAADYESLASAAVVAMLVHIAAFRTATNTATPALAKVNVAEDDAGPGSTNVLGSTLVRTGAWAVVRLGPTRRLQRAFNTWGREGDATVHLHIAAQTGDDAASIVRRGRNLQGAVASGIEAAFGTTLADGTLALTAGWCELADVVVDDEAGSTAGYACAPLTIHWSDLP